MRCPLARCLNRSRTTVAGKPGFSEAGLSFRFKDILINLKELLLRTQPEPRLVTMNQFSTTDTLYDDRDLRLRQALRLTSLGIYSTR